MGKHKNHDPSNVEAPGNTEALATAIDRMLTLRWPTYADTDRLHDLQLDSYTTVSQTTPSDTLHTSEPINVLVNNFYLPIVNVDQRQEPSPYETRRDTVEFDAERACQLAHLIATGPFAACNERVAAAFEANIRDATTELIAAYENEEHGSIDTTHETYGYNAGLTLQALQHVLAGIAVQLGAIDRQEAFVDFQTQSYEGISYGSTRLQRGGRTNSYGIRYLGEMEHGPEDDWGETPTILDISAIPGKRVAFGLRFLSGTLTQRFNSEMTMNNHTYHMGDFSIRIDYDEKSPSGFSVDIGRDMRDTDTITRTPDAAGAALQAVCPEDGSHFWRHFDSVTTEDMEEFITNLADILGADAEMNRYVQDLRARMAFNAA